MSGGQGPDELLPESVAMKMYALTQGIPDDDILVEAHSKHTRKYAFSKETMIEDFGNANFQAILLQTIITFSGRVFSLEWLA